MAWLVLVVSGVFEAVWAAALDASQGFRRRGPVVVFLVGLTISMIGLAFAMREIPTGTAYAVWTGVGAALTVLWAFASRQERVNPMKIAVLTVLIGCVIGLKAVG